MPKSWKTLSDRGVKIRQGRLSTCQPDEDLQNSPRGLCCNNCRKMPNSMRTKCSYRNRLKLVRTEHYATIGNDSPKFHCRSNRNLDPERSRSALFFVNFEDQSAFCRLNSIWIYRFITRPCPCRQRKDLATALGKPGILRVFLRLVGQNS